jgi:hypothetical protein
MELNGVFTGGFRDLYIESIEFKTTFMTPKFRRLNGLLIYILVQTTTEIKKKL